MNHIHRLHVTNMAFDDPRYGLEAEPFVLGTDALLELLAVRAEADPNNFQLIFSREEFPGSDKLDMLFEQLGGAWYGLRGTIAAGWLCPAMDHYFPEGKPTTIYVRVEAA